MGAITTMTSKGQLTIPKEVRDALNLPAGTRFHVMAVDGRVVAVPKNKKISEVFGMLGRPPSGKFPTDDEIEQGIGEFLREDDERIKREYNEHIASLKDRRTEN
jgi:antitoxin PrlF